MLRSKAAVATKADRLIASYIDFAEGYVNNATNTANRPLMAVDLRALAQTTKTYQNLATECIADPGFDSLEADVQADIRDILAETAAALEEIDEEADPEKKWSRLTKQEKDEATQRVLVSPEAVDHVRARLKLQKKGQPAHKPPKRAEPVAVP